MLPSQCPVTQSESAVQLSPSGVVPSLPAPHSPASQSAPPPVFTTLLPPSPGCEVGSGEGSGDTVGSLETPVSVACGSGVGVVLVSGSGVGLGSAGVPGSGLPEADGSGSIDPGSAEVGSGSEFGSTAVSVSAAWGSAVSPVCIEGSTDASTSTGAMSLRLCNSALAWQATDAAAAISTTASLRSNIQIFARLNSPPLQSH